MSDQQRIFRIYRDLLPLFPDDLHLARPLIHLLEQAGRREEAAQLAMNMARRMQSVGRYREELGFLAICRRLDHPDRETLRDMESMARIMADAGADEAAEGRVFSLIEQLSDQEAREFLLQGEEVRLAPGQVVVEQGEVSRNFYLILRGEMAVEMRKGGGGVVRLATLRPGQYFGEFACIYRIPRSATVRAEGEGRVLEFSDRAIHGLIERSPIAGERLMAVVQQRMVHSLTFEHPAFAELIDDDRRWLAESARVREFRAGEWISQDCAAEGRWLIMLHGRQEWIVRLKPAGTAAPGTMLFGGSRFLRRPETMLRAAEDSLVCEAPPAIFESFMKAYAGFEQWVKRQGEEAGAARPEAEAR